MNTDRLRFGVFEADLRTGELRKNAVRIKLAPQSFQLLVALAERSGELVTREELQQILWPNATVVEFDSSINSAIKRIRTALNESAGEPRYLETLPRRGYRFLVPVERVRGESAEPDSALTPLLPPIAVSSDGADGQSVGDVVAHYRILGVLGRGGMGIVYRAEDIRLGRQVALKSLLELNSDPVALKRFVQEARTTSTLNHPNICTIYGVEWDSGRPFIAMELLEGETLVDWLTTSSPTRGLDLNFLVDLAIQIATAVEAAHERGIIHRDIKPANVFLTRRSGVKVLDFGLAKSAPRRRTVVAGIPARFDASSESDPLTNSGATPGTASYMSPEQARGEDLDSRSDLYSLGVLLCEAATGELPLNHRPVAGGVALPETFRQILERLLEPDRELRYQSAADLSSDLRRLKRDVSSSVMSGRAQAPQEFSPNKGQLSRPDENETAKIAPWPKTRPAWGWWALGVLIVSAAGWLMSERARIPPVRKLEGVQVTTNESENRVLVAAVSPDGKRLAYADTDGLFLRILANGSTHPLRMTGDVVVNRIEWFPDQIHLLLSGSKTDDGRNQIWMTSILDDERRLIREDAENGTPSPDGTKVAFTALGGSEIWVGGAEGENPKFFAKDDAGGVFSTLFWAADGRRLSYALHRYAPRPSHTDNRELEANYAAEYGSRDVDSGKLVFSAKNISFESACVTNSGRMLYLHTKPWNDAGLRGIWEVQTDEQTGALLSAPRLLVSLGENRAYGLSVSADGKQIVSVSERGQPDIYVGDLLWPGPALSNIRRLTSDSKRDFPHGWTPDSQAVLFESDREGVFHIFRQRLDQRTARQLSNGEGGQVVPQLAPDASVVLYDSLKGHVAGASDSLYRVGLDGGNTSEVSLGGPLDEFRCPAKGTGCVLRETVNHRQYVYYALDPLKGKGQVLGRTAWIPNTFGDWALAPDGSAVALPYHDRQPPQIRVVPLQPAGGRAETELSVRTAGVLWGITWAANGVGWFANIRRTATTSSLAYIDVAGRTTFLREMGYNTWGVPSPDGRRLAFVDYTSDRNVWIWH